MVVAIVMAIPAGLEPATLCLEGRCSIQLSYGTALSDSQPYIAGGLSESKEICA